VPSLRPENALIPKQGRIATNLSKITCKACARGAERMLAYADVCLRMLFMRMLFMRMLFIRMLFIRMLHRHNLPRGAARGAAVGVFVTTECYRETQTERLRLMQRNRQRERARERASERQKARQTKRKREKRERERYAAHASKKMGEQRGMCLLTVSEEVMFANYVGVVGLPN
jgi:hypothetical protein